MNTKIPTTNNNTADQSFVQQAKQNIQSNTPFGTNSFSDEAFVQQAKQDLGKTSVGNFQNSISSVNTAVNTAAGVSNSIEQSEVAKVKQSLQ